MKLPALLVLAAIALSAAPAKLLPPPGIAVPDGDRKELEAGLLQFETKLKGVRSHPRSADAEIYYKAVKYALEGGEFFKAEEIAHAKELLRTGMDRADSLAKKDAPWLKATGLVVRGYRSKIDGSVQPYGLYVPTSFAPDRPHKWRLDTRGCTVATKRSAK